MRILYWAEAFWPTIGGIEVLSAHLIDVLRNRGHEFIVVTDHRNLNLADEMQYKDIPVYRFHFQRTLERQDISQISAIIQKVAKLKETFRPDLVHVNTCGPSLFFFLRTDAACTAPSLITIHALLTRAGGRNTILGQILRKVDWVSAVSASILEETLQVLPDIASRSSTIHNSLDMPNIQPMPLPFDTPRLLCLGRLVSEKGFDLALTAFRLLSRRFPLTRLIIAGDGPAKADLKKYTDELELSDSVDFLGWVEPERIPELMNTVTMVVMPSRWNEPFGLVALQAAQMARPVVAARVGGLPEVVIHGETGILVEKEDPDALGEAMKFILSHPGTAVQMGEAARCRAQQVFNWERFVNNYDALYKKLSEKMVSVKRPGRPDA